MSRPPKSPVFLERSTYRQRRLRDAALLMPIVGIVLWTIPLLWPRDVSDTVTSSHPIIYIFGVWVLLIALTAITSHLVRQDGDDIASRDDAD